MLKPKSKINTWIEFYLYHVFGVIVNTNLFALVYIVYLYIFIIS